jgi:glycosyltransferase involved in cell wall biosynthesis
MKLLFITQIIDESHDDLAFTAQWVDEFIAQGYDVEVLCLQKGEFDDRFPVFSLGKEKGFGKVRRISRFFKYIFTHKYDKVFVHMNPEYFTLGGWWWYLNRVPMYLWYTHYTTHIHLKFAAFYCKKMFAATKQSLPQYDESPKKVVTGHGIDINFWHRENECKNAKNIIMVHRLSRSKRVELGIQSLALLPEEYTLTIYGRAIDEPYFKELQQLVCTLNLTDRVVFKGPVPMPKLRTIYPQHKIMINMASETIDKTMLEAMVNGVFPVTTSSNLEAIGLPFSLSHETPESIARFILSDQITDFTQKQLVDLVKEKHSLEKLIKKLSQKIDV